MAPKRSIQSSSSEGESEDDDVPEEERRNDAVDSEEEGSDEKEDEEEEGDEGMRNEKSPAKRPLESRLRDRKPESSSSEEESELESELGSDIAPPSPEASNFTIKPITPKAGIRSSTKRPAEQKPSEKASVKKKTISGDDENAKKVGYPRLWSEGDEIAVLNGMIEYRSKKGADPFANMDGFYDFIEKSLHVRVSKNQLIEKIRRLRKKYQNNAKRGHNGEDPVFSKPHELKSFELSKQIWAGKAIANGRENRGKPNDAVEKENVSKKEAGAKGKAIVENEMDARKESSNREVQARDLSDLAIGRRVDLGDKEEACILSDYPILSESYALYPNHQRTLLRSNVGRIGRSKLEVFEAKWRELRLQELKLQGKKLELINEHSQLVIESNTS